MKRFFKIISIVLLISSSISCKKFLEETPKSFLTTSQFYKTPQQIQAAVNGCYVGLAQPWASTFLGLPISPVLSLEYLTGYSDMTFPQGTDEANFLAPGDPIPNNIGYLKIWWTSLYYPLENCNSVIANVSNTTVVDEATKNKYIGEARFLRAWYYFKRVQLFGPIPLKTTPTKGLDSLLLPKAPLEDLYNQIVTDLTEAEKSGLPMTDKSGRVTLGAIKSLLSKVYLTMAGYPLKKGNDYYQKAYDKAKEVIASNAYSLFATYEDIRNPANENAGGHIFMLQGDPTLVPNIMAYSAYPYLGANSPMTVIGGGMTPSIEFYNSYDNADQRRTGYFITQSPDYQNPSVMVTFDQPYVSKYWDAAGEKVQRYGANIPLIRYADILLVCAEAKASLDGGTTSDQDAINAYLQVHKRAFPTATKPASITFDEVFKERCWELCYESQTWYDMLRTRKAFDVVNNKLVDLVGYKAPNHVRAFKESDLLLPIPLTEIDLNPLLK